LNKAFLAVEDCTY